MGGGVGDRSGGIFGLHRFVTEHGEALRYDLLTLGRSLDDLGDDLSWLDVQAVVRWSPRSSALFRSMHPNLADWDVNAHLLALLADLLAAGNWQRGGGKGTRPKSLPRPEATSSVGRTVLSLDEMDALLGYSPRT